MTIVFDGSALVALLSDSGDDGHWAESLLADDTAAGPELVLAETMNILRRLERTGDLSRFEAASAYRDLLKLDIELYPFVPLAERVWALRHNLTSYDAWYVAVAEELGCQLATLDRRLSRAQGPTCEIVVPPVAQ